MLPPTTLLRSFGNRGAVENVRAVLDQRRREEWIVASLLHHLDDSTVPDAAPAASRSHAV